MLGITRLIERDKVPVWVKNRKRMVSPRSFLERSVRVNYAVFRALRMELFNPSHADPASCCLVNFPVSACPKVDAD